MPIKMLNPIVGTGAKELENNQFSCPIIGTPKKWKKITLQWVNHFLASIYALSNK